MNRSELKKRLSVLLTTACVLSVIPTPAFAAEISDVDIAEATVVEVEETAFAGDDALVDEPVAEEVTEEAVVEDLLEEEPAADAADATAALADDIFVIGDGNDAVSPNVVPVSGSKVPTVSVDQVVAKQKIDLKAIAKEAGISVNLVKFKVKDKPSKKLVKVNKNGIVTTKGKASGWATIDAYKEKTKNAEVAAVFNIYVSVPEYVNKTARGKAVKTITLINRNDTISLDGMLKVVDANGKKINPVFIDVKAKEGTFEKDETDKFNTVLRFKNNKKNTGSAKVTVYYGEKVGSKAEKKLCAKYTYTIKAKVPKIKKAVTIKVNKTKTLKLSALPKSGASVSWNMYAVSGNDIVSNNKLVSSNIIKIEPKTNKKNIAASAKVTGLAEGTVAIVPEINGYTDWEGYACIVTVAPGKKK